MINDFVLKSIKLSLYSIEYDSWRENIILNKYKKRVFFPLANKFLFIELHIHSFRRMMRKN